MINNIAFAWIGPVFFVSLGTVLVLDTQPADWLGRAELAFVVLDIAYVQYQIISLKASDCLMLTACLLDLSVPRALTSGRPITCPSDCDTGPWSPGQGCRTPPIPSAGFGAALD